MMRVSNLYDCAATYLYNVPTSMKRELSKKERKVEAVDAVYTGKRFNPNAGTNANFASHIDICI